MITALAFGLYFLIDELFFQSWYQSLRELTGFPALSFGVAYLAVGLPILLAAFWLFRKDWLTGLGLNQSLLKGAGLALLFTLPMLIGYAIVFPLNQELSFQKIMIGAVFAGFFEELYFRGGLFGFIFRYTKVGFIPAILIGALLFASVHLYQSQDPSVLVGIFLTTFMGAILFAWTFIEWEENLWVPIFLHLFMNFFWMLFSAGENALGGTYANVFRLMTIAAVIIGTISWKRKQKLPLAINRHSLMWKKEAE
ncbi:MAG: CPBP family intramembrane glutamic endopeptidase [Bacteroidota bacterium]